MDNSSFIKFFIVLAIYYCLMIGRFIYFGYVKGPKEIRRLQLENRDADVAKWQKYIDKCKINIALFAAVGLFSLVIFLGEIF